MQDCLHEEVVNDALPGAVFRQRDVEPLHQASPRRLVQLLAARVPDIEICQHVPSNQCCGSGIRCLVNPWIRDG